MKLTDGTLDVVFSKFMCFSFTITLSPEDLRALQDSEIACSMPTTQRSSGLLPQGYCERKTYKS